MEHPVHSKVFKDGCLCSSAHLCPTYRSSARCSAASLGRRQKAWVASHGAQENSSLDLSPLRKKSECDPRGPRMPNGTQPLATTDRGSGHIHPSLKGYASPAPGAQSHTEAVVKSEDSIQGGRSKSLLNSQSSRGPSPAGAQAQQPGGSGCVASSFPIGPGETQTAPRQLGLQGQLGRHSCFQVSSSKSNHMRIYNPSWGLGSISLNSLAPEMQVSQRRTGSVSPSK